MSRRDFVGVTAMGILSAIPSSAGAETPKSGNALPLRVDTHVHCFSGADHPRFPYHEKAPYRPETAATPEHLLDCMNGAGVDYAVIVHPEPYQDDHRYLEYCLEKGGGRLKGTCLFFADRPGSIAKLPDLVKRIPLVAARIHAYAPDRLPPFGKPELRAYWKLISDHGLAVQLHFEPRYAPGFEPFIGEFSDTKVIIDHLGRPFQGTPEEHERVIRWGRFKNTVIKLSAIPPPTTYPHRQIGPIIERLLKSYGPDRMIYGGGFGAEATGTTYRAAFEKGREYLGSLSRSDQYKILGGNAVRLFGFGGEQRAL